MIRSPSSFAAPFTGQPRFSFGPGQVRARVEPVDHAVAVAVRVRAAAVLGRARHRRAPVLRVEDAVAVGVERRRGRRRQGGRRWRWRRRRAATGAGAAFRGIDTCTPAKTRQSGVPHPLTSPNPAPASTRTGGATSKAPYPLSSTEVSSSRSNGRDAGRRAASTAPSSSGSPVGPLQPVRRAELTGELAPELLVGQPLPVPERRPEVHSQPDAPSVRDAASSGCTATPSR